MEHGLIESMDFSTTGIPCPSEIILHVFSYLELDDVCAVSCVSIQWNQIASNETLWRSLCEAKTKLSCQTWKEATIKLRRHIISEDKKVIEYKNHVDKWMSNSKNRSIVEEVVQSPPKQGEEHCFGIDLKTLAKELYILIYNCKSRERGSWTKDKHYIMGAMDRYYKFMKLKEQYPDVLLIPTLDIEHIWRSHMIRPSVYRRDCEKLFSGLVPHSIMLSRYQTLVRTVALRETCRLWKEKYGEPYGINLDLAPVQRYSLNTSHNPPDIYSELEKYEGYCIINKQKMSMEILLDFSRKHRITGQVRFDDVEYALRATWSKDKTLLLDIDSFTYKGIDVSFAGVFSEENFSGSITDLSENRIGSFDVRKFTIPSGLWEGTVQWIEGTFNGHSLCTTPEKMRVFLVFDTDGKIYGGGSQRDKYFEVRVLGKYDKETNDVEWTKVCY
eukprot:TRINITY_DN5166_c0_g1_i3.p1 TRINITY_DN5166_c0_g1~~TRINITY_DN5166_c0_g1_i3.p1  ORF type:complete len:443 (+),score=36.27 TRINITY_DN5166_c0_g1_i3:383-1711(+)